MKIFIPIYSLLVSIVSFILSWLAKYIFLLTQYKDFLFYLGFISLVVVIVSLILLIKNRGLTEWINSIIDSENARQFLRIIGKINEFNSQTQLDPVQRVFNSCLYYTSINYFRDHVEVRICVPNSEEAAKILREKEKHLLDQLDRYPFMKRYMLNHKSEKNGQFDVYRGSKKKDDK